MTAKILRGVSVVAVAASTLVLGACDAIGSTTEFRDEMTSPDKITAVTVQSGSGTVSLKPSPDARTLVQRTVRHTSDRPGSTARVSAGTLSLEGCGPRPANDTCVVSYTVLVPAGASVSGKGGSGAVVVEAAGAVDLKVGSGDLTVINASGAVRAETGSGDVTVSLATAQDVHARTGSGKATVTVPAGRYRVEVDTGSGAKEITVPHDPGGDHLLSLHTGSGRAKADLAR